LHLEESGKIDFGCRSDVDHDKLLGQGRSPHFITEGNKIRKDD
jgi:hypothetical protein